MLYYNSFSTIFWEIFLKLFNLYLLLKKSTNYFKIIICTTLLLLCSLLYFQGQSENVYSEQELENDSYTTSSSADFTVSLHTTDIDIIEIDKININETIKLICKQNGTDSLNISMFLN